MLEQNLKKLLTKWMSRGYEAGLPDEGPKDLVDLGLVVDYKSIALCILNNDMYLTKLGGSRPKSKWYSALKAQEIADRKAGIAFSSLMGRQDKGA